MRQSIENFMKVKEISHSELVELCSQGTENRNVWIEFCSRFDQHIWSVVYRECEGKIIFEKFSQSSQVVQDLVQEVYLKLLDKDCKALRTFHGAYKNSIYLYLGTIAKNVVRNYLIKKSAKKRPPISSSMNDVVMVSDTGDEIHVIDQIESNQDGVEDKFSLEFLQQEIDEILDKFLKGKQKRGTNLFLN